MVRRTNVRRWWLACTLIANVASAQASSTPAPADLQRARTLFAEAEAFEGKSEWKEALVRLEQAFAIKSTPGIRFHIGYCREKLGAKKTALEDYRRAAELATAEKKDDVRKTAEDAIKRLLPNIPTVLIIPSIPGTTITIDKTTAIENVPFPIDAGNHSIRIEKDGFEPYVDSFSIAPEERSAKIEVRLHEKVQPTAKSNGPTQGRDAAIAATTPNDAQPASSGASGPRSHTAAWITTVSAIVLAGGGLTAFILAGSSASGECRVTGDCESDRSKVRVLDWTAASMWTAAAGLGVVSIVLWSKGHGDSATTRPRLIETARPQRHARSIQLTEATALPTQGGFSFTIRGAFE